MNMYCDGWRAERRSERQQSSSYKEVKLHVNKLVHDDNLADNVIKAEEKGESQEEEQGIKLMRAAEDQFHEETSRSAP